MPLDRTHAGGALMFIDAKNYSDQNVRATVNVPMTGGQTSVTAQPLNYGMGVSQFGAGHHAVSAVGRHQPRAGRLYPLRGHEARRCGLVFDAERRRTGAPEQYQPARHRVAKDPLQDNVPPSYAIYMFDPANQTWLEVAAPPTGFMYTDPIPLQARTEPYSVAPTSVDPALAAQKLAQIEVVSAYDTDLLGRMGDPVISTADLPNGCAAAIAKVAPPTDPAGDAAAGCRILKIKDPANAAYGCTPVRFVRAIRAIAPPSNSIGERQAIGNTNFEQTQILGYAMVEPDGSFKLNIPADTPVDSRSPTHRAGRSRSTPTGSRPVPAKSAPATAATARGAVRRSTPARW